MSRNEVSWMTKHRKETVSNDTTRYDTGPPQPPACKYTSVSSLLPLFFFVSFFPPFYTRTSFHYVISPYSSPKRRSKQHGTESREVCVLDGTLPQKQNRLEQPRVITTTDLDVQHQQKFVKQFRQRGNANVPNYVPSVVTETSTYATCRCTLSNVL